MDLFLKMRTQFKFGTYCHGNKTLDVENLKKNKTMNRSIKFIKN